MNPHPLIPTLPSAGSRQLEAQLIATSPTRGAKRLLGLAAASVALAVTAHAAAAWQVVASGLNNPRGLDFAPNGALFIAEAGTGGDGPELMGAEGPVRFGLSGSITRLWKGTQERIVTGLPSLAGEGGFAAVGPSGISFGPLGHAMLTIGLGQNPAARDEKLGSAGAGLGSLYQLNQNGKLKLLADVAAFEGLTNADGKLPDSNPNGVYADEGATFVADAGANTLVQVKANGSISIAAFFPERLVPRPFGAPGVMPMQAVPTNVVRGPDGALYVSQLTGFPFPVGGARVYRVVPGSAPTVYAEGFTNIIDLEFDAKGNLYVLEIDANGLLAPAATGRLARVNAAGGPVQTIASTGLVMPGGLAIGPDGGIYVTNFSTSPGAGEVVRIQP